MNCLKKGSFELYLISSTDALAHKHSTNSLTMITLQLNYQPILVMLKDASIAGKFLNRSVMMMMMIMIIIIIIRIIIITIIIITIIMIIIID